MCIFINEQEKKFTMLRNDVFLRVFLFRVGTLGINDFTNIREKESKGGRRMPRLWEAKKDVVSCDKLRVGANDL